MKTLIFVSTLLLCFITCIEAARIGCGSGSRLSAQIDLLPHGHGRRRLSADFKPCNAQAMVQIVGESLDEVNVEDARHCCVECKNIKECIAWSHNVRKRKCTLFADMPNLQRVNNSKYISGDLSDWRSTSKPAADIPDTNISTESPAASTDGSIPAPSDENQQPSSSDESPSPSPIDESPSPSPVPQPPPPPPFQPNKPLVPGKVMPGKVLYGRRLNSYMPCRGNVVTDQNQCVSLCQGRTGCQGWSFTSGFDCGWLGVSAPMNLCYLMADLDGGAVFDQGPGENFVSGWI